MEQKKSGPPQIRRDYRETQPDREKEKKKDLSNAQAVTKRQLETLQAQERKPQVRQQLTPGGQLEYAVHSQEEIARRNKIAEVKRKLNAAKQDMGKRFGRSR